MKATVFKKGEKIVCVNPHGYPRLTEGKTYKVEAYEAECAGSAYFTWPAYVTVRDDGGKLSSGHATRFKKAE